MFKKLIFLFSVICAASSFASGNLRVLTLNLGAIMPFSSSTEARISSFCEEIKTKDYDVILLQEVWISSYRELVKKKCDFKYSLDLDEQSGLDRNIEKGRVSSPSMRGINFVLSNLFGHLGLDSGLLILSRYKLNSPKRLIFSESGDEKYIFDGESFVSKGAIGATIKHPKLGDIFIATTHLVSDYIDHDYQEQKKLQLTELAAWFKVNSRRGKSILGGDFNISPPSDKRRRHLNTSNLWENLKNNYLKDFAALNSDFSDLTTFPGTGQDDDEGVVDHIFGHGGIIPLKGEITLKNGFSDHYGFEAIFGTQDLSLF
ncbi:endonuclease/exonuclease/phosphatase family protein [Bacteriovorax sp. Seq25_V]|uniref:endonuclease/exonuclease/phosphatase family protein n=1 Tax=Bacteriovorax sp. Seq25_V TaxID=1201288 RepID=UPI0012F76868|nr:endonuclease/exonuclease/phosphatase family protein [Bacteriovorax sp. Seq25_V]